MGFDLALGVLQECEEKRVVRQKVYHFLSSSEDVKALKPIDLFSGEKAGSLADLSPPRNDPFSFRKSREKR
jgi:hypothetical protein